MDGDGFACSGSSEVAEEGVVPYLAPSDRLDLSLGKPHGFLVGIRICFKPPDRGRFERP